MYVVVSASVSLCQSLKYFCFYFCVCVCVCVFWAHARTPTATPFYPPPRLRGTGHSPESRSPAQWWAQRAVDAMGPATRLQRAKGTTSPARSSRHRPFPAAGPPAPFSSPLPSCRLTGSSMTAPPHLPGGRQGWRRGRNFGCTSLLRPRVHVPPSPPLHSESPGNPGVSPEVAKEEASPTLWPRIP